MLQYLAYSRYIHIFAVILIVSSTVKSPKNILPASKTRACVLGKRQCGPLGKFAGILGVKKKLRTIIKLLIPQLAKAHEVVQIPVTAKSGPFLELTEAINRICEKRHITGMDIVKYARERLADAGIERTVAEVGKLLQEISKLDSSDINVHAASEAKMKQKLEAQGISEFEIELAASTGHELFTEMNKLSDGTLIAPTYENAVAKHLEAQEKANAALRINHLEITPPACSERSRKILTELAAA